MNLFSKSATEYFCNNIFHLLALKRQIKYIYFAQLISSFAIEAREEYIIREAAEDIIRRHQALGNNEPWKNPDFQKEILELQIQRESRIPKNIERVFIDRGIPDGLAYVAPGSETAEEIKRNTPSYDLIFLIENLGSTATNRVRREDQAQALELEKKLIQIYKNFGYGIIRIPPTTLQERAGRILEYLEHDAMTQPEMGTSRRKT